MSKPVQYTVTDLKISGNDFFRATTLKRLMVSRPGWLWNRRIYNPGLLAEDLENVRQYYRQHGFLEMQIVSHHVSTDSASGHVAIDILVDEGERTFVEGIHLFGNRIFSDSLLETRLRIKSGNPLVMKKIDESQNQLLAYYAESGYLDARVTVQVKTSETSHRAILDFSIEENRICRLHQTHLVGLKKTQSRVVLRELKVDSGEVIRYSKLLESQRRLYMTGLFQYAYVKPGIPDSLNPELHDLRIEVEEHQYGEFNWKLGYGSEDKARTRAEIAHKNLGGTARKLALQGWLSFIQWGVMASFTDPWLAGRPINADLNVFTEYKEEPGYRLYRSGGQGILGRKLSGSSDIRLTLRQDFSRFSHVRSLPDNKTKANIRSIRWSLTYDTRNNLFDTQKGIYSAFSYELARAVFDEPVLFHRWEGEGKLFVHYRELVFGTGLEFGWLRTDSDIHAIPLNERYYVGGQGSVRGYAYKKIGPLSEDGYPSGGLVKLVWRIGEIRFPLVRSLKGAIFSDAGNCWEKTSAVEWSGLRASLGAGVRLHSFLGIVRVDYAWKLDRRTGEKPGAWVFNMGHAF